MPPCVISMKSDGSQQVNVANCDYAVVQGVFIVEEAKICFGSTLCTTVVL
jgi:hypothetical protein